MPKLNSQELKHKRKILNWAGENWHKLKEVSKVRIWCVMYDKSTPTMLKGEGFDHKTFILQYPEGYKKIEQNQSPETISSRVH